MRVFLLVLVLVASNVAIASNSSTPTAMAPKKIQVDGVTVLTAQSVDEVVARYVGRPLDFVELKRLRVDLSRLYLDAGFVNSGFVIPDQPVSDTLRVQAIEGELSRVEITGSSRLRPSYLRRRMQGRISAPLNVGEVQQTLRWLQTDSNIARVDAELLPGIDPGESVLSLAVDDSPRISVGLGANNHRSATLGAEAATLHLSARNLSGYGEKTQFSGAISDGVDSYSISSEIPISRVNTALRIYYAKSDSQIIETRFKSLNIESQSKTLGIGLSHPIYETVEERLLVTLALENKTSKSSILDTPFSFSPGAEDGRSETAAVELGLDWERRLENSALAAQVSYRRGFYALGATHRPAGDAIESLLNPTGADGKFGRLLVQGLAALRLDRWFEHFDERAQLLVRGTVQLAFDPLMSLEKIAVGGANSVRGYRENTFVRDSGAFVSAELQLPVWGYRADAHPLNLVVAPFVDFGWSWDDTNVNPGQGDTSKTRSISSLGIGLIWQPLSGLHAALYWGEPIADNLGIDDRTEVNTDYDLQDDGVHFLLSYNYRF